MEHMESPLPEESEASTGEVKKRQLGPIFTVALIAFALTGGIMAALYYAGPSMSKKLMIDHRSMRFLLVGLAVLGGSALVSSLLYWATTQKIGAVEALVFFPLGVMGLSLIVGAFGYAGWLVLSLLVGGANVFISVAIGAAVVYIFYTLMVE